MAKTLQSFRGWAVNQGGHIGNPGVGNYAGQCVSLVQQYLNQVFDVPYQARGNAKDFVPPTFTRVSGSPQPGDILRYGANYGGGYGHIGLIDDDGLFLDQNGDKVLAVNRRSAPYAGYESIWRPTKPFAIKNQTDGRRAAKGTATVLALALNVRNSPDTNGEVVATYSKGQTFNYDSFIISNGFVWLSYISNSGARRYVAEGPYDGNRSNVYVSGGIS